MNDAAVVSVLHGVTHAGHQRKTRSALELVDAGILVERPPADEFHREERPAVFDKSGIVDLGNARVLQSTENLRLVMEPLGVLGRDEPRTNHLECDGAARVILFGLIHHAHAAFAANSQDAIATERGRHGGRKGQGGADTGGRAPQELRRALSQCVEVQ